MSRLQVKLVAALAGLVVLIAAIGGYAGWRALHERTEAQAARALERQAGLVATLLGELPLRAELAGPLQDVVRSAATASGARVTLIAPDGSVVADSDVAVADLWRVENHGGRPEIREALNGGVGSSRRRSVTVGRDLLYVAVPNPRGPGVIRLSLDLARVDADAYALCQIVAAGGLAALAVAGLAFWGVFSSGVSQPLERIRHTLGALESGDLSARVHLAAHDEIGEIADAVDRVGGELELRLREITGEKEQLQAVLSGMVEGVLVLDGEGRVSLANPRLRQLFDLRGDVAGKRAIEAIRSAEVEEALSEAARGDTPIVREIESGTGDRRILRLHASGYSTGEGRGVVALFDDVTEVRHLEAVRRDFVTNASHELKTPLTAIRGFAETLLSGDVPPEDARRQLSIIVAHSERLSRLVEDLLELSRAESGRLALERLPIDVPQIARDILQSLEARLRERSIEASVVESGTGPALADRAAVEQVLENLLDNAIKYTDPGGKVEVRVREDPQGIRVEVADTGLGIPEADRARIFERFYRVDKARSRALGGTGLGLSIVKHLVQDMGGELSVESTPGAGSTFSFTLPRA